MCQAAFNTFESEGYSREQALRIMSNNAISIAVRVRDMFCPGTEAVHPNDIRIVLSLGTYGSTVYDGIFPPPYGPKAHSATEANTTSFGDDLEGVDRSIQALTEFHAERLLAYAHIPEAWDLMDGITFETIPVAREVTAIRRAVTAVVASLRAEGRHVKTWRLTAVFPNGARRRTFQVESASAPRRWQTSWYGRVWTRRGGRWLFRVELVSTTWRWNIWMDHRSRSRKPVFR